MLGQIKIFYRQIIPIHRFGTEGRAEKIDECLRLLFRGKPAQSMFRHAGRWVPKGQLNGAALVYPKRPVPDLIPAR